AGRKITILRHLPLRKIEVGTIVDDRRARTAFVELNFHGHPWVRCALESIADCIRQYLVDAELQVSRQPPSDTAIGTLLIKPCIEPGNLRRCRREADPGTCSHL